MVHTTLHGLLDEPCSADGCEEGPRNGSERVDIAAIDDPAKQIDGDSSEAISIRDIFVKSLTNRCYVIKESERKFRKKDADSRLLKPAHLMDWPG